MSLQTLSEWLRCPNCFRPLSPAGPLTLRCGAGHSFDVNKRGYVSLAGGSRRLIGDSAAMVDARALFLATGWYEPLRERLADRVAAENPTRVLDVGCGTGYYLKGVLGLSPGVSALGMDLSPVAVGRTVSGQDQIDGLVADVWSPLPVRDSSADVILNVFAPRNPLEFHRVLREDGMLVVVVPQASHLKELRTSGLVLDVPPNKGDHLSATLSPAFELETRDELSYSLHLDEAQAAALIGMGPGAHHTDSDALTLQLSRMQTVTASFELLGYRRISI